VFELEILK